MDELAALHVTRILARTDLYFLLRFVLSTKHWVNPETGKNFWINDWLFDRCREVQNSPDNILRIWARYHCKSTILTFGETIRSLLVNPNETIGIFSVTKAVADEFVGQVKQEFETNETLKELFPDVVWRDPQRESPRWTLEKGFSVRRPLNLKDASVRGFGLLDTSFTGHRISIAVYDDASNETNVTTADQIAKSINKWELSLNTGMPGTRRRYIGTFYAYGDLYHTIASRGVPLSLRPCFEIIPEESKFDEDSGLPIHIEVDESKPVLFSHSHLKGEEQMMGPVTFGCQMLCNPAAGTVTAFKRAWLRFYKRDPLEERKDKTVYVLVDPANEKKKDSSYTAMWVVGLGPDKNVYILDGVWDRMNLSERTDALFDLVQRWSPLQTRYEKYGLQADIGHMRYVMEIRKFRFEIVEVGGRTQKNDRINRLVPLFSAGRIWMPKALPYRTVQGEELDLIKVFLDREYHRYPATLELDMLDALARVAEPEMPLIWPRPKDYWQTARRDKWRSMLYKKTPAPRSWMSA